ncbi:MAG: hypothetical protein J3R72DRAFT_455348 [Linnemannia gamsii]|nr:MAG: hypothetical protein J3R72DRAFT_455348 [Linnemannia gamsii]
MVPTFFIFSFFFFPSSSSSSSFLSLLSFSTQSRRLLFSLQHIHLPVHFNNNHSNTSRPDRTDRTISSGHQKPSTFLLYSGTPCLNSNN